MAMMNLSVSSIPYAIGGTAAIALVVSVTDAQGAPYTGLQKANFHIQWLLDGSNPQAIKSMTVDEYKVANGLPALPGVYGIDLHSQGTTWVPAKVWVSTFYVAVKEDNNHGQMLYTPADELLPL